MSGVAGVAPAPPARGPAVAAAAPSPAPEPDAARAADAAGVSPQVEQELRDQVRAPHRVPPPGELQYILVSWVRFCASVIQYINV